MTCLIRCGRSSRRGAEYPLWHRASARVRWNTGLKPTISSQVPLSWETRHRLNIAARNSPLLSLAINAALVAYILLPPPPPRGDGPVICMTLLVGALLSLAARWVPIHAIRVLATIFGFV